MRVQTVMGHSLATNVNSPTVRVSRSSRYLGAEESP